jgi:hypothetical protein
VTAPVASRTVFRSEQLAGSKRTTELTFNIACSIPRDSARPIWGIQTYRENKQNQQLTCLYSVAVKTRTVAVAIDAEITIRITSTAGTT